mgnify:CR=1 FL=1
MRKRSVDILLQCADEVSRLVKKINNHQKIVSELEKEKKSIQRQIEYINELSWQRRDAIQKRWDTRRSARKAKNEIHKMLKQPRFQNLTSGGVRLLQKSANEINDCVVKKSSPIDRKQLRPGIYFLISNGSVVYVGQSKNILGRVACHTEKNFDRVAFLNCCESELNATERLFIDALMPELNADLMTNRKRRESWVSQ